MSCQSLRLGFPALALAWAVLSLHDAAAQSPVVPKEQPARRAYLARLPWELRSSAEEHGNRLTVAGKERLILLGDVKNSTTGSSQALQVVREDSDKVRVELANGDKVTLDGAELGKTGNAAAEFNEKLTESLFEDFPDTFFLNFPLEKKALLLAGRARPEGTIAGSYNGPYFNIYGVGREDRIRSAKSKINKLYFFNFDSQLLDRVQYPVQSGGTTVLVTTYFEDYRKVDEQQIPFRIRRTEDGREVLNVTLRGASVSGKQADNAFRAN